MIMELESMVSVHLSDQIYKIPCVILYNDYVGAVYEDDWDSIEWYICMYVSEDTDQLKTEVHSKNKNKIQSIHDQKLFFDCLIFSFGNLQILYSQMSLKLYKGLEDGYFIVSREHECKWWAKFT